MHEDSDIFDPKNIMMAQQTTVSQSETETAQTEQTSQNCFTQIGTTFSETFPYSSFPYAQQQQQNHQPPIISTTTTTTTMELDTEISYNIGNYSFNSKYNSNKHGSIHDSNWDNSTNYVPKMQFSYTQTQTPDLLNLLQNNVIPISPNNNSSISFETLTPTTAQNPSFSGNGSSSYYPMMVSESSNFSTVSYDPLLHLNIQAPFFHGYNNNNTMIMTPPPTSSRGDFVFGGNILDHDESGNCKGNGILVHHHHHHGDGRDFDNHNNNNGVLEFTQDVVDCVGGNEKRGGKRTRKFTTTTERQRRVDLSSKFDALKDLIPNPSKNDRASVVGDAINYIRELLRTVNELTLLVEKKRYEKQRVKKQKKVELEGDKILLEDSNNNDLKKMKKKHDDNDDDVVVVDQKDDDGHSHIESLRSSWIQRKSKDTEVEVRIIDNEVNIKLVQRKRVINGCLMNASQVLNELNLDLQHVSGGHIGDFYSFMFNSKICESSSVYASAIANKLIEVMDTSLAAV